MNKDVCTSHHHQEAILSQSKNHSNPLIRICMLSLNFQKSNLTFEAQTQQLKGQFDLSGRLQTVPAWAVYTTLNQASQCWCELKVTSVWADWGEKKTKDIPIRFPGMPNEQQRTRCANLTSQIITFFVHLLIRVTTWMTTATSVTMISHTQCEEATDNIQPSKRLLPLFLSSVGLFKCGKML